MRTKPLDQCGTKACQDWRAEIRLQLEQGATEQEIKDNFQRRYGDRVLAEPPREGINWILWLLPVALVLFGGIWFARYLRQLQAGKTILRRLFLRHPATQLRRLPG